MRQFDFEFEVPFLVWYAAVYLLLKVLSVQGLFWISYIAPDPSLLSSYLHFGGLEVVTLLAIVYRYGRQFLVKRAADSQG